MLLSPHRGDTMSKIGENIKKFRVERNMTQADLGERVGKAPSVIANWEAGTNRPDVDSVMKMCSVFEIDANTLFGWELVTGNEKATRDDVEGGFNALLSSWGVRKEDLTAEKIALVHSVVKAIVESKVK